MPFRTTVKPLTLPVTAFIKPESGAVILPSNLLSNTSLDGISANCMTFSAVKNSPSYTPLLASKSCVSFCASFTHFAGAVGSSSKKIIAVGPSKSCTCTGCSVSCNAILKILFLRTS